MAITVKYNGMNLSKIFAVSDVRRPSPEFRVSTSQVEGVDGEAFGGLTVAPRECSLVVACTDKSKRGLQDAARELMAALAVREPKRLTFSDERDPNGEQLHRYAVPIGQFDYQEFVRSGTWQLRFIQPDPYLLGKRRSVVLKKNRGQKVSIGGNAEAWLTLSAGPSGKSYTFEVVGGDHVTYKADFAADSKLAIDMRSQTARLSPAVPGADGLQTGSRFPALSGTVTIRANAPTTVTWTERWL